MLKITKRSRKKPQAGDIFVVQMPDRLFRYGRVIRVDANVGGLPAMLVYIFGVSSPTKLPLPSLRKEELLVPPLLMNETGWRDGYFETVGHCPLKAEDVLPVHCFYDDPFRRYVDADGNSLPQRYEPCGFYGLGGYGSVDLKISLALGFPEPTEDPAGSVADSEVSGEPKRKRKRREVNHEVQICLANAGSGPLAREFGQFEDRLIEAVTQAGVGEWEGHEFALDGSHAFIHLYGKDADRLAEVVLPIARQAGLPKGSFLVKRYGEPGYPEERINL
jgi:hypothetical protein